MIKIGITGQSGFLGTHLYNTIGLYPEKFIRIPFEDSYFDDQEKLSTFVSQCEVIVHLAAVNRHNEPDFIYKTNIKLAEKLINALDVSDNCSHILFSSSIQEDFTNPYGQSKKEGREMLADCAKRKGALFTGMIFPNIFGPFGHPYYNSFVATFSHQLTHNETPRIDVDNNVPLIYVAEAVDRIIDSILKNKNEKELRIASTSNKKVTEILNILQQFKTFYFEKGIIPVINGLFEQNLFNTFRCYIDLKSHNPFQLKSNLDERGSFVEVIKSNLGGQFSFSTTKPGVTRGNHYHIRKVERFAVIKGQARIQLRRIGTNEILNFYLSGNEPSFVDMPIWYTHNITNVGDDDLYTLFWINEFYDPADTDTYFEQV